MTSIGSSSRRLRPESHVVAYPCPSLPAPPARAEAQRVLSPTARTTTPSRATASRALRRTARPASRRRPMDRGPRRAGRRAGRLRAGPSAGLGSWARSGQRPRRERLARDETARMLDGRVGVRRELQLDSRLRDLFAGGDVGHLANACRQRRSTRARSRTGMASSRDDSSRSVNPSSPSSPCRARERAAAAAGSC